MKNKILVAAGLAVGVGYIGYVSNNKSKKMALAGAGLGLIIAALAIPKMFPEQSKVLVVRA